MKRRHCSAAGSLALVLTIIGPPFATLVQAADVSLPTITVEDHSQDQDGTAEIGYKTDVVPELGPWGAKKMLDTPYSAVVMGEDLIANTQARDPEQLLKMNPLTTAASVFDINNISNITTRGFGTANVLVNGMANNGLGLGVFIEDVESMEVISGLSGFMYGVGNVGGVINYNLKKPTYEYVNKITAGNYGGNQWYGHADLGGPIKDGKFAYRFNALIQDGETVIDDQDLRKGMVSGAVDFNATDALLFRFNLFYGKYDLSGRQTQFWTGDATVPYIPEAMAGDKLYGPDNTFNEVETLNAGLSMNYDISSIFTARAAYNHRDIERKMLYAATADFLFPASGPRYQYNIMADDTTRAADSLYGYLDAKFDTFGVKHKVTVGSNGFYQTNDSGIFNAPGGAVNVPRVGPFSWDINDGHAGYSQAPDLYQYYDSKVKNAVSSNYNIVLGDDIRFSDQWSVLAGVNYSRIRNINYNGVTGAETNTYDDGAFTPAFSLLYKPIPTLTTYFSYMEALEQGQIVTGTYKNAGSILEPLRSEQYEVGVKKEWRGMLLTAALFQIDKGLQYSDDNTPYGTYVQDGRQVHRGLETTAQGKLFRDLTVLAGFAYLDPEVKETSNPDIRGKEPIFVPKVAAKLYAEYSLPFLQGLALTGGVYYNGKSEANTLNTMELPSYTIGDLGVRYTTKLSGLDTTLRLNVNNITDERYWTGQPLGSARAVIFSAEVRF